MNTFHLFEKFVKAPLTPEEVAKARTPEGLTCRGAYSIRSLPTGGFGLVSPAGEMARRIGPFLWVSPTITNGLRAETRAKITDITVPVLLLRTGGPATLHALLANQEGIMRGTAQVYAYHGYSYERGVTLSQALANGGYRTLEGEHWSLDA